MKKSLRTFLIVILFLASAQIAYAVWPIAAAVPWLLEVSGGSILIYDLTIGAAGVLSGLLWADCTYQITSCTDKTKLTDAVSGNQVNAKAPLRAKLQPDSKRLNPNTKQWNDPVTPSRDVTPKTSFTSPGSDKTGLPAVPSGISAIYNDILANGYQASTVTKARDYADATGPLIWAYTAHVTNPPATITVQSIALGTVTLNFYSTSVSDFYSGRPLVTCPSGYTLGGTTCTLTVDPTTVQKPTTTTCEVLWDSVGKAFQFDSANPNCNGLASSLVSNGVLTVTDGAGISTSIKPQSDNSMQLTKTTSTGDSTTINTAPYDSAQGGYPIIGSQSGTGTPAPAPSPGGSGGSCGGTGQPECGVLVNDTGIPNAPTSTSEGSALKGAIDGMDAAYTSRVNNNLGDHGITWASVFPDLMFGAPVTSCQPLSINLSAIRAGSTNLSGTMTFDWCNNAFILMLREILKWLLYVATVWYIWRRFMSAEISGQPSE